jgi:hypothetical protein
MERSGDDPQENCLAGRPPASHSCPDAGTRQTRVTCFLVEVSHRRLIDKVNNAIELGKRPSSFVRNEESIQRGEDGEYHFSVWWLTSATYNVSLVGTLGECYVGGAPRLQPNQAESRIRQG